MDDSIPVVIEVVVVVVVVAVVVAKVNGSVGAEIDDDDDELRLDTGLNSKVSESSPLNLFEAILSLIGKFGSFIFEAVNGFKDVGIAE